VKETRTGTKDNAQTAYQTDRRAGFLCKFLERVTDRGIRV